MFIQGIMVINAVVLKILNGNIFTVQINLYRIKSNRSFYSDAVLIFRFCFRN